MTRKFDKEHGLNVLLATAFIFIFIPLTLALMAYLPWSIGLLWERLLNFNTNMIFQWLIGGITLLAFWIIWKTLCGLYFGVGALYEYLFPDEVSRK